MCKQKERKEDHNKNTTKNFASILFGFVKEGEIKQGVK
jgi:hypothetical protein